MAWIRPQPLGQLAVLLSIAIHGYYSCTASGEKCTGFLRSSKFQNVPPTIKFALPSRTCPAPAVRSLFLPPPHVARLTPAATPCDFCALFKQSLPPISLGSRVPPTLKFGWRDSRRIVAPALLQNGFQVATTSHDYNHTDWYAIWHASHNIARKLFTKPWQKYGRLPYLPRLSNKATLALVSRQLHNLFPHLPQLKTFILPQEGAQFKSEWRENSSSVWVLKPILNSASRGIRVVHGRKQVAPLFKSPSKGANSRPRVIQEYAPNPYLIYGRKAEPRVFVIVTGTMPLRAYISTPSATVIKHGLKMHMMDPASFRDPCVHTLPRYGCPDRMTHTRLDRIRAKDLNETQIERIQHQIDEIVIDVLLLQQEKAWQHSRRILLNKYSGYYALAFDFFLDQHLNVYLNEVNNLQAIHSESECGHVPIAVMNLVGNNLPPLSRQQRTLLHKCLNNGTAALSGGLEFDERLHTIKLGRVERSKQRHVIRRLVGLKSERQLARILNLILKKLTPSDVRFLISVFDEEARAEPHFRQLLPIRGSKAHSTLEESWKRLELYMKVLVHGKDKLHRGVVPMDGATSALYYYALYEAYAQKHGADTSKIQTKTAISPFD